MSGGICGDDRFETIESAKRELLRCTNIESSPDEMACIDSLLFRMWQMGWLPGCGKGGRRDTVEEVNEAKLREAVERSIRSLLDAICDKDFGDDVAFIVGAVKHNIESLKVALSTPARNCDVGTAEEQAKRLDAFCDSHGHGFDGQKCYSYENCPFISIDRCELTWAQMPYEEGGAK